MGKSCKYIIRYNNIQMQLPHILYNFYTSVLVLKKKKNNIVDTCIFCEQIVFPKKLKFFTGTCNNM